ncbi:MAG: hypothetical protein JWM95_2167 [Gemmatimonadetes bacterium]|nr:hypothetical protein [Gemmatimonadota bacterium]
MSIRGVVQRVVGKPDGPQERDVVTTRRLPIFNSRKTDRRANKTVEGSYLRESTRRTHPAHDSTLFGWRRAYVSPTACKLPDEAMPKYRSRAGCIARQLGMPEHGEIAPGSFLRAVTGSECIRPFGMEPKERPSIPTTFVVVGDIREDIPREGLRARTHMQHPGAVKEIVVPRGGRVHCDGYPLVPHCRPRGSRQDVDASSPLGIRDAKGERIENACDYPLTSRGVRYKVGGIDRIGDSTQCAGRHGSGFARHLQPMRWPRRGPR